VVVVVVGVGGDVLNPSVSFLARRIIFLVCRFIRVVAVAVVVGVRLTRVCLWFGGEV
jgi:hypothetical protein